MMNVRHSTSYFPQTWTLTAQQEKALDGVYTRMLRIAFNVSWNDYVRNVNLYGGLPRVSAKVRERRMRLAGHCVRHPELSANPFTLWETIYRVLEREGEGGPPTSVY